MAVAVLPGISSWGTCPHLSKTRTRQFSSRWPNRFAKKDRPNLILCSPFHECGNTNGWQCPLERTPVQRSHQQHLGPAMLQAMRHRLKDFVPPHLCHVRRIKKRSSAERTGYMAVEKPHREFTPHRPFQGFIQKYLTAHTPATGKQHQCTNMRGIPLGKRQTPPAPQELPMRSTSSRSCESM